jgi:hypothetical protein
MNCHGLLGRLLGHAYRPRYSESAPTIKRVNELYDEALLPKIVEASKSRTYHGDVCTRCGDVVNRVPS